MQTIKILPVSFLPMHESKRESCKFFSDEQISLQTLMHSSCFANSQSLVLISGWIEIKTQ